MGSVRRQKEVEQSSEAEAGFERKSKQKKKMIKRRKEMGLVVAIGVGEVVCGL